MLLSMVIKNAGISSCRISREAARRIRGKPVTFVSEKPSLAAGNQPRILKIAGAAALGVRSADPKYIPGSN